MLLCGESPPAGDNACGLIGLGPVVVELYKKPGNVVAIAVVGLGVRESPASPENAIIW